MKKLQYLFYGAMATLLMAADCSNKDNEFYNDVFINAPNVVDVEDFPVHFTGEPITVNANFSKIIGEAGQNTDLDLFRTTGGAKSFTFSFLIEKKTTGDEWVTVNIADDDVVEFGGNSVSFGDFLLAQAEFDEATQSYKYRGGIRLNTAGEYRLRFTYNNAVSSNIVLVSDSFAGNLFVTINTTCSDIDSTGYYYFTAE